MEKLTLNEIRVLLRLYYSHYQKGWIKSKAGSIREICEEINADKLFSESWLIATLNKFIKMNALCFEGIDKKPHNPEGGYAYQRVWYVSKQTIWEILSEDELIKEVFELFEDRYWIAQK